jgi:hypothetical protein
MNNNIILPIIKTKNETNNKTNIYTKERKIRYDKTTTMKFPLTESENALLTHYWLIYKKHWQERFKEELSITMFNTMLLRFAFKNPRFIKHDIEYKNTKLLKTVKLNQLEKEKIAGSHGLRVHWQLTSERKALHRIMLSMLYYLQNGGVLSYEDTKPSKPH